MIRVHRAKERSHTHREAQTLSHVLAAVLARRDGVGNVAGLRETQARRYFALLASRSGGDESLPLGEDMNLWLACIDPGEIRVMPLRSGRRAWIQMLRGSASVNGNRLAEGDGAAASDVGTLTLLGREQAEILMLDMGEGRRRVIEVIYE